MTTSGVLCRPCPITRCPRQIPPHLLLCGFHWHMVPPALRAAVRSAGEGACAAALASVREQIARNARTEPRPWNDYADDW